jgi:hypothetical protein
MKAATDAAKALRDFNDSLKLGNLSALSKGAQYDVAKAQYSAHTGDQAAATAFLQASQARGGSKLDYAKDFDMVSAGNSAAAAAHEVSAAAIPAMWAMFQQAQPVQQAASTSGWDGNFDFYSKADGSHAGGLDYVPFDGYRAILHKGESVKTAAETRNGDSGTREEIKQMRTELRAALEAIALNTSSSARHAQRTSDVLQRVTRDGNSLLTSAA